MIEPPTRTTADAHVRLELAGNRPLLLDDPEAAWVVRAGAADVFAVPMENGVPVGAREHICHVPIGCALFGMASRDAAVALVAVGRPGTVLELFDDADDGRLVEGWVRALTAALGDPAPRDVVELVVDRPVDAAAGAAVQPSDDLVWVTIAEGRMELQGVGGAFVDVAADPFPLSSSTWLKAVEPSHVVAKASSGTPGGAARSLWHFHRVVLDAMTTHLDAVSDARAARSRARSAADEASLDDGLRELLEFFRTGAGRAERRSGPGAADDELLAACSIVGRTLGVTVEPPPPREAGDRDRVAGIARASRLRVRQVTLDGEWWRSPCGPLLGFDAATGRPVALVPTSARSYRVVDPATGSRMRVTAEVAASLSPNAHTFYRPFPDRPLGAVDLLRFGLRGGARDGWTIVVMGVLGGLTALVVPIATGLLFSRFIPAGDAGGVAQVAIAMFASVGAIAAFQLTRAIAVSRLGAQLDLSLEAAAWDRLLRLPAPFFREHSSGDLALRATRISALRRALSGVVTTAVLGLVFSAFSFALLFVYDVGLALVATGLLVAALAVGAVALVVQVRAWRSVYRVFGRQTGQVLGMLNGISKLRVAGAEARAFAAWARLVPGATPRRAELVATYVNVIYAALPLIALLVIFPVAVLRSGTDLTAGTFLAFNAALTQVITAVIALGTSLSAIAQIVPMYERIKPILTTLPETDEARADPGELAGDVEVSDVTFRYVADGPPVLQQASFRARPGEFVALVGPSGSGKSTILRLLLGFETPESGSIHFDAQDLATLDLQAVRRQMGVVLQSGKLASGSIYQNIVGSSAFTMDEAWEAARSSGLDQDIRQMPMGMHTKVIEGGGGLSGGQRQRLLIARAIIGKPRILLFDEATSALDNRTQAVVSESLERLHATRIVIAHRLSTVVNADRIHVVEAGRIVESGTYEQLMQLDGSFAALASRQLA